MLELRRWGHPWATGAYAVVGLLFSALSLGCTHECRCVCLDGSSRIVSTSPGRARLTQGRPAPLRPKPWPLSWDDPFMAVSPQPPPKPALYADPQDLEPTVYEPRRRGKFEAGVALEDADTIAADRAHPQQQPTAEETKASARAEEMRQRLQQITRP